MLPDAPPRRGVVATAGERISLPDPLIGVTLDRLLQVGAAGSAQVVAYRSRGRRMDASSIAFWVRVVHVLAASAVLGGALLLTLAALGAATAKSGVPGTVEPLATQYEWLFWLAAGLLVVTGVGNLAAFGVGLPPADSRWGIRLTAKLWGVVYLLLLSLVRTALVVQVAYAAPGRAPIARGGWLWPVLYGATALGAAALLILAVGLAHG